MADPWVWQFGTKRNTVTGDCKRAKKDALDIVNNECMQKPESLPCYRYASDAVPGTSCII